MMPTPEAAELIELVLDIAGSELAPEAAEYEAAGRFSREAFRLIGAEGQGFPVAMSALDAGRLGIAACATGLAPPVRPARLTEAAS
jgi:hypothetical protein